MNLRDRVMKPAGAYEKFKFASCSGRGLAILGYCKIMWVSMAIYLAVMIAVILFAVLFRHQQNKKTLAGEWVGGEISWPKAFWLAWAVGAWFLLPLSFLGLPALPEPLKIVLIGHLVSWWFRGPLELVMIYKWFNWSPVYGISHDAVHNWALVTGLIWAAGKIGWDAIATNPTAGFTFAFLNLVAFSLMAEMVFAALFIATRGKDSHKIYFASDDPIYRLINNLTAAVCWIVYAGTFAIGLGLALNAGRNQMAGG